MQPVAISGKSRGRKNSRNSQSRCRGFDRLPETSHPGEPACAPVLLVSLIAARPLIAASARFMVWPATDEPRRADAVVLFARCQIRQRLIPRSSRRRSPQVPAGTRESPQRRSRKALLTAGIPAYSHSARNYHDRPVTPELAGSSPVAPVENILQIKSLLSVLARTTDGFRPASRDDPAREISCEPGAKSAANGPWSVAGLGARAKPPVLGHPRADPARA